jgi:ubiquinone/menaquinone biosynthesis C-methylase UbiE
LKYLDRVIAQSGRAWFEKVGSRDENPFSLNGYGCAATAGGDALLTALVDDIRRKIAPLDRPRLLEVGCGAGAMTAGLAAGACRSVAVDFSHAMLKHASRATSQSLVAGDASRLPFQSESFDRVVCYSVFNNFPSLDFAEIVVRELVRVAKAGGVVLIGQIPNAARRDDWYRAYAERFGSKRSSTMRRPIGAIKQRGLTVLRAALALAGKRPSPALHFQYYTAEFFEQIASRCLLTCEVLPAYNLLADDAENLLADYRIDVKLTIPAERAAR